MRHRLRSFPPFYFVSHVSKFRSSCCLLRACVLSGPNHGYAPHPPSSLLLSASPLFFAFSRALLPPARHSRWCGPHTHTHTKGSRWAVPRLRDARRSSLVPPLRSAVEAGGGRGRRRGDAVEQGREGSRRCVPPNARCLDRQAFSSFFVSFLTRPTCTGCLTWLFALLSLTVLTCVGCRVGADVGALDSVSVRACVRMSVSTACSGAAFSQLQPCGGTVASLVVAVRALCVLCLSSAAFPPFLWSPSPARRASGVDGGAWGGEGGRAGPEGGGENCADALVTLSCGPSNLCVCVPPSSTRERCLPPSIFVLCTFSSPLALPFGLPQRGLKKKKTISDVHLMKKAAVYLRGSGAGRVRAPLCHTCVILTSKEKGLAYSHGRRTRERLARCFFFRVSQACVTVFVCAVRRGV